MQKQDKQKFHSPLEAVINGISNLGRKRTVSGVLLPGDRIEGKKVLITGASSGLGLATAKQLAARGATVIMAVRSGIPEKGEEVKRNSGNAQVFMHRVDLSDLRSIEALVEEIRSAYGTIDILVDNAGVVAGHSRKTPQGFEEMFAVNFLAKVALIRLLLKHSVLKSGQAGIPRIIIVSSESHRDPEAIRWDEFGQYREHTMGKTVALYGYTKLLLTTFARELSRRLNPGTETRCSVFALCPGPVNTNIGREAPWIFKPLMAVIFWLFFRSPRKAAAPVLYFACASEMEGKAWDYFFLMSRKEIDPKAEDPGNGRPLWQKAEQLLIDSGLDLGRSEGLS